MSSRLPGFHRLSLAERRRALVALGRLDEGAPPTLGEKGADRLVENAIGTHELPLGVGANLLVNGRERFAPMAIEEPSVVAAASHGAKLLRAGGGVEVSLDAPEMIGQVQLLDVPAPEEARRRIESEREALLALANEHDPRLVAAGGGAVDLAVRVLPPSDGEDAGLGTMLVVHLVVDVREAMGANAVNTMCEALAPPLATLSGGRALLRILSNLADRRLAHARGRVPLAALPGGEAEARGVVAASVFAERDPYRAATHNKGVMNGVDAVLVALGQDWRAVEAGAHAWACRDGQYRPLSRWRIEQDALVGTLTLPMAVGTVGGVVRAHQGVQANLRLADVRDAADLATLAAAVGLAQNLAALRALASEGIQQGHMRLAARKGSEG